MEPSSPTPRPNVAQELQAPARFRIERRLGGGGFGEVFEAFDQERNAAVALKVLRRTDPAALYRFKREFRTLADLVHRNLVTLHELILDREQWLLSMELVRGTNFFEYVYERADRHGAPTPAPTSSPFADLTTASLSGVLDRPGADTPGLRAPVPGQPREDCLRAGLAQLVEGVSFLHSHGILHRDIKPSNVLVTGEGRVVLLDFGLATELMWDAHTEGLDFAGTPEYMSPEQAAGAALTEASDWYSVGVMLYLTLTGQLPFTGSLLNVLADKQERDAPPVNAVVSGRPADLVSLCQALLGRDPAARPAGPEILRRLQVGPQPLTLPAIEDRRGPDRSRTFVGRDHHLSVLREALAQVRRGQTVTVHVSGGSGMGKTAVVSHFLRMVQETEPDVLVLTGRCYEREEVPYKALDAIVDSLANHLRGLPRGQAESLLPRGMAALARVFPVLQRIAAVAAATAKRPALDVQDFHELRRRASAAFREMLGRLSERRPLILFIDDLQWGDVDSASLLRELVRPPDQPPLLLIAAFRDEETASSPMLRAWLPSQAATAATSVVRTVQVGELTTSETNALVQALMGDASSAERVDAIRRESGGSPFFVDQLVRHAIAGGTDTSLETVLRNRAQLLTPSARTLLEVTAVAGRPLDLGIASSAADLERSDSDVVAWLRANQFVRTRGADKRHQIEPYHDRIRQTILASLSADTLRRHHHRLGLALEASGRADPEELAVHFEGAGDAGKAAYYALAAADRASRALAFDRAARLYRLALDLQPGDQPDRGKRWLQLADALANAGRVIESAHAYLTAAEGAEPNLRSALQGQAAEQLLIGGHLDEGFKVLQTVLDAEGMKLAATPRRALLSVLLRRPYVLWRGTRFRERSADQVPPDELRRIDISHAVVRSLGFTDSMRAIEFQTRHFVRALNAGEPQRVARALAFEAMADGRRPRTRPRAERLLATLTALMDRIESAHLRLNLGGRHDTEIDRGILHVIPGMVAYLSGRWREAHQEFKRGEQLYRDRCALPYQIVVCQVYGLSALMYAGEFAEFFRRVPECLSESLDRGNVYAEANLRLHNASVYCFRDDDPDKAFDELRLAMARWSPRGFHVEHTIELRRRCDFALYCGDPATAWKALGDHWPALSKSFLLHLETAYVLTVSTRARVALAMALQTPAGHSRRGLLDAAERDAHRLVRKRTAWGTALSQLVRAGLAVERGDTTQALALLAEAEAGFDSGGMGLHAAVTRCRRGAMIGGDEGRDLAAHGIRWMSDQGLKNHARMNDMIAPGLP